MNGTENDFEKTAVTTVDPNVTQAVPTPGAEATTMSANVECPVCRTPNPPSERYCIDCGFLLAQQPVDVEAVPEVPSAGTLATPDGIREFPLKLGENTVGRENADVLLAHNSVSRNHAVIRVEDGRFFVEDLGSTNGTFVDGAKIEPNTPAELKDGAELRFGNEPLILKLPEIGEGEAPAEPEVATDVEAAGAEPEAEEAETAEESAAEEAQPVAPVARLVSKDGALTFDLALGMHKIGRRQGENEIVVPDPYASGHHADLAVEDDKIVLTDAGSSNGTTVNSSKIEPNVPCELHPGDEITIGQTALTLEAI